MPILKPMISCSVGVESGLWLALERVDDGEVAEAHAGCPRQRAGDGSGAHREDVSTRPCLHEAPGIAQLPHPTLSCAFSVACVSARRKGCRRAIRPLHKSDTVMKTFIA